MLIIMDAWFERPETLVGHQVEVPDDFDKWTERQQTAFLEKIALLMRTLEVEDIEWSKP